jgi:hypothetical protein
LRITDLERRVGHAERLEQVLLQVSVQRVWPVSVVIGTPVARSRLPKAPSKMIPSAVAAAAITPGASPDSAACLRPSAILFVSAMISPAERACDAGLRRSSEDGPYQSFSLRDFSLRLSIFLLIS